MKNLFRLSCLSVAGITALACGVFACSSTTNNAQNTADGGGGGGGEGGGGEAGMGSDGSSGGDGGTTADGGATGPRGSILVTQSRLGASFNYSVNAAFSPPFKPTSTGAGVPTTTTIGPCSASVIPTAPANDAGPPAAVSGLNAGAITLAGSGMPASTMLVYGPLMQQPGISGYSTGKGSTKLYSDGDTMTLSGAGGPDLPAFSAQTLVAPTEVVITAPVCGGTCPDLDRTKDLVVTWTGGGAGKVVVTFETVADTQAVILQCSFDPAAGTGTVPAALLAKLDKAGDPNVSGVEIISDVNKSEFDVGGTPTTFTIQSTNIESLLTVSN